MAGEVNDVASSKRYLSKINLGNTTYRLKDSEARDAVSTLQTTVASSLVFKGVVSKASDITSLTAYAQGWTYKANASFEITDIGKLENGDMIICISDYNGGYKATDWTVVQNNVDTFVGATTSADGTRGLVPAPSQIDDSYANHDTYFLKADGTWESVLYSTNIYYTCDSKDTLIQPVSDYGGRLVGGSIVTIHFLYDIPEGTKTILPNSSGEGVGTMTNGREYSDDNYFTSKIDAGDTITCIYDGLNSYVVIGIVKATSSEVTWGNMSDLVDLEEGEEKDLAEEMT